MSLFSWFIYFNSDISQILFFQFREIQQNLFLNKEKCADLKKWSGKNGILYLQIILSVCLLYWMYLLMNFLWKSLLSESLMKVFSFLSDSALEQFLKTTSSSQRRLTFMSDLSAADDEAYFSRKRGLPDKMFSILQKQYLLVISPLLEI